MEGHEPSVYRELLSQFREGYAKYSKASLELEGLTDKVRFELSEDERRCQLERIGFVSWLRAVQYRCVEYGFWVWGAVGIPAFSRNRKLRAFSLEALKCFRPLAERAGAHLPINIRDGFPCEAIDAGSRWYCLLWWILRSDHDGSQPGGIETISASPFEDSARVIEWCGLAGDSPAWPPEGEHTNGHAVETDEMQEASKAASPNGPSGDQSAMDRQKEVTPVAQSTCVQLFGYGQHPIVNGKRKSLLTKARYDVVMALIGAGDIGLSLKDLENKSRHSEPQKRLYELCKDRDWKSVICLPGKNGQGKGYRIL